jgi:hypothetical protein
LDAGQLSFVSGRDSVFGAEQLLLADTSES